jgi:hypothetical protein
MPWPEEYLLIDSARIDIKIVKGASFFFKIVLNKSDRTPVDMSGFSGKAQLRDFDRNLLATFAVTLTNIGELFLELLPEQTLAISVLPSEDRTSIGRFDCLIEDEIGKKIIPIWGEVTFDLAETVE